MARPKKDGLDYYPMDSDIANDDKIKYIRSKHGNDGFATVILLLNKIYKEKGYYCNWTPFEKTIFSVDSLVEVSKLDEIIASCIECRFFDEELYKKYEILTSKGVQNRFMEATKRRRDFYVYKEYILDNVNINPSFRIVNVNNNSTEDDVKADDVGNNGESKVKESKKERKGKESSSNTTTTTDISSVIHFYENNGYGTMSGKTQEDIHYWIKDFQEIGATYEDAIELIIFAFAQGVDYNKRSYAYANKVLIDWEQKRYLTVDQVKADKNKRNSQTKQNELPEVEDDGLGW